MVFNMSFIKMQEEKKSSLIFISQEYAVRTKKKNLFLLANFANLLSSPQQRDFIPTSWSTHYFICWIKTSHLHVTSAERQHLSLPLEPADTLSSQNVLLS